MIAGGVALLWRRSARAGAGRSRHLFIFAVFWLPRLYTAPHFLGLSIPIYVGVLAGVGHGTHRVRGGALIYAVTDNKQFIMAANGSYRSLEYLDCARSTSA